MRSTSERLARVLAALKNVRQTADGWIASCPAHDDSTPSLSIADGRSGRVLLKCHAGCETDAVVAAAGLSVRDLFDDSAASRHGSPARIVAEYPYCDEQGTKLFDVIRLNPKSFRQRASSGEWSMKGVRHVPYRLPQLIEAVEADRTVFVVEGEKDVHALVELGLVATTNPGGAGKWRNEYAAHFRGARVVVLPDNDAPGHRHALDVAARLFTVAKEVRVVALPRVPEKGDASDWLGAGGTVDQLKALVRSTPPLTEPPPANNGRDVADPIPSETDEAATEAAFSSLDPLPTLGAAAFVGPIGQYVAALRGKTEASPAILLVSLLTGFGAMIGRGPHWLIDGQRHGTNLFTVVFGGTAVGRKSTGLAHMRLLLEEVDPAFWKGPTARVLGGFGSGEALISRLAPALDEDGAPSAVTEDPRLLIEEGELGALLTIKRRDGNTMNHTLRALWDGAQVSNVTKHHRAVVSEHHVAMIGAITGEELRTLLSAHDAATGFANRLLFVYSARADVLPNPEAPSQQMIARTAEQLRLALRAVPRAFMFDSAAMRWWEQYYVADAARTGSGGPSERLNARRLPILRRIALVYCVADGRYEVTVQDLEAARAIVEYSCASVALAFCDSDPLPSDARKLLDALTVAGVAGLARGHWAAEVFGSKATTTKRLHEAAKILLTRGLAFPTREPSGGGRPREVWRVARFAAAAGWTEAANGDLGEEGDLDEQPQPASRNRGLLLPHFPHKPRTERDGHGETNAAEEDEDLTTDSPPRECDEDVRPYRQLV